MFGGDYWGTLQTQDDEVLLVDAVFLVWENCTVEMILSTNTLGIL
jgi:hypothetical protein